MVCVGTSPRDTFDSPLAFRCFSAFTFIELFPFLLELAAVMSSLLKMKVIMMRLELENQLLL
jgi:hypothetical protein